jgi:hypothetical protein
MWFCSLNKARQIALVVLFAHFAAIFWMSIDHLISSSPKKRQPIVVRTIRLQSIDPIRIAPSTPAKGSSSPKETLARPAPTLQSLQKNPPAPNKTKKGTEKPRESVRKPSLPERALAKPIPAQALQEIEEELKALSTPSPQRKKAGPDIKLPSFIQSATAVQASVEENVSSSAIPSSYHLSLIEHFQSCLQLPEVGEIKAKIVLASPGTLSSIQILDAKSEKNAAWLRKELPLLELPSFHDFGIVDAFLEFTITFTNAENH